MAEGEYTYVYRSLADLQALGERVRDTAIRVTLTHAEQYAMAQQRANNQATRDFSEYAPPDSGRPDDDARLRAFIADEFAGIPALFTAFAIPDPQSCQPMVDAFYRCAATLQPTLELKVSSRKLYDSFYIGNDKLDYSVSTTTRAIALRMQHWEGSAADRFEAYMGAFADSIGVQRQLAVSLGLTLQAQLDLKQRMLTDVWTVGQTTIKTLDALDRFHCPTRGGAAMIFTVIGAISAIGLAAAGQGLLAFVAMASEGAQGLGSVLSTSGPYTVQQPLEGGTVPDVIRSMQQGLNRIVSIVDQKGQELAADLRTLNEQVDELRNAIQPAPPLSNPELLKTTVADLDETGGKLFFDR
jgi:hypothetical protein